MHYIEWFGERLARLRTAKGVSARDMSLSLGQSESYINKIENKKAFPSMNVFIYICEYLNVTPSDFFNPDIKAPDKLDELIKLAGDFSNEKLTALINLIKAFKME